MIRIGKPLAGSLLGALLALAATGTAPAAHAAAPCRGGLEPWTEIDLYLGRDIPGGDVVSEGQFRQFLAEVVTPRFPDGLSVLDVEGQFRSSTGAIVREQSRLLVILVPDAAVIADKVGQIVADYKQRFGQESVLRAEHPVCLAFE